MNNINPQLSPESRNIEVPASIVRRLDVTRTAVLLANTATQPIVDSRHRQSELTASSLAAERAAQEQSVVEAQAPYTEVQANVPMSDEVAQHQAARAENARQQLDIISRLN